MIFFAQPRKIYSKHFANIFDGWTKKNKEALLSTFYVDKGLERTRSVFDKCIDMILSFVPNRQVFWDQCFELSATDAILRNEHMSFSSLLHLYFYIALELNSEICRPWQLRTHEFCLLASNFSLRRSSCSTLHLRTIDESRLKNGCKESSSNEEYKKRLSSF